jgi:hypothetical protein
MANRDWCFTAWNEPQFNEKMRYMVYGEELCPKTNKLHYQGFVMFKLQHRLKKTKELLECGVETHIEPRRGTRDQARNYCMKDNKYKEFGQFEPFSKEQLFKQPIPYIKENHPEFYCRYYKGLERLQDKGEKWRNIEVKYIWGCSGSGKTRMIMEMDNVYKIDPPYKWWDGYEGEDILLIDDFQEGQVERGYLLNLLDGYRMRLETKGSHTWAKWTKVFITSNFAPPVDRAIQRRIGIVTHLQ